MSERWKSGTNSARYLAQGTSKQLSNDELDSQVVLKCSAGMDYSEFYQFLCLITLPRLSQLQSLLSIEVPVSWLQDLRSLIAKFTSGPLSFFPDGKLALPQDHQPADGMDMILSSTSETLHLPVSSEDVKLLSSEVNKDSINLLMFRTYELQVILSVLQEMNI